MAGITSTFAFKLIHTTISSTSPHLLPSLSSSDSKLFGSRLSISTSPRLDPPTTSISFAPITARYGGGGDYRRSRNDSDDEQDVSDFDSSSSASVRLIDENQNMVGIVPTSQAVQMAEDAELDLVMVSPDADPPVVKIMDFNKFKYEKQKRKRDQQKKSAGRVDVKELKMGYNIDQHDYSVRLRAAQKFLKDGDKVKVMVNLKGRQNEFKNMAIELIRRFRDDIGELAVEEAKSFRDSNIFMVLVPKKTLPQKASEPPKKEDQSAADEVSASVQS